MSSLPPYNPEPGGRAVWLLAAAGPGELAGALPGAPAFGRVATGGAEFAAELNRLLPAAEVAVVADPAEVVPGGDVLLVVGAQEYVERVLGAVMGMPPTGARLVLLPGRPSVVELIDGRAVLTHLNPGRGLA